MKPPFFTVIIPTYNRAQMLLESIESVLNQTYNDFELIVVDDHSTDHTKDVVASIQDSRMKYILNDHLKGNSGARNAGIFRGQGEWTAFLDDDDTWLPQKLELVHNKICNIENDVGLIYTGFVSCNFDTGQQISTHVPEKRGWIQRDLFIDNCVGTPSAVCVKTDVLRKIEGFDERINHFEDGDLYVRIAELGKIDFIEEVLTNYRISNSDRLSITLEKGLTSFDLFWKKHKKLINKSPQLRHRAAARVFSCAVSAKSLKHIIESLPWTVAGLFLDIRHFNKTLRTVMSILFRQCFVRK